MRRTDVSIHRDFISLADDDAAVMYGTAHAIEIYQECEYRNPKIKKSRRDIDIPAHLSETYQVLNKRSNSIPDTPIPDYANANIETGI